jgi:hypothetical protein
MKEKCEYFEHCEIFHNPMFLNSGLAAPIRVEFCQGCKYNCARYKVASQVGENFLTTTLLPFMKDRAEAIIAECSLVTA